MSVEDAINDGLISVVCATQYETRPALRVDTPRSSPGFSISPVSSPRGRSRTWKYEKTLKEDLMSCFREWAQSQASALEKLSAKHQSQLDEACKTILAALQSCSRASVDAAVPVENGVNPSIGLRVAENKKVQTNSHSDMIARATKTPMLVSQNSSMSLMPPTTEHHPANVDLNGTGDIAHCFRMPELKKARTKEVCLVDLEDLEAKVRPEVLEKWAGIQNKRLLGPSYLERRMSKYKRGSAGFSLRGSIQIVRSAMSQKKQSSRTEGHMEQTPSSSMPAGPAPFSMSRRSHENLPGLLNSIVAGPKGKKRWGVFQSVVATSKYIQEGLARCEEDETRLQMFVRSSHFDMLCAVFIVAFMIVLGVETDDTVRRGGKTSTEFFILTLCFNSWFTIELLLRLAAEGKKFCFGEDSFLNMMDICLVLTSVADLIIGLLLGDAGFSGLDTDAVSRLMRAIRVLRAVRIVRLARFMRYIYQLRKMVCLIQGCFSTLFWCMVMMLAFVYTFALLFTQGVTDYIFSVEYQEDKPDHIRELERYYGSVGRSMNSLFQSMSTGLSWGAVFDPLAKTGWLYSSIFMVFVTLSLFGVLNVMTSVFVESTMKSALAYRDLIITDSERSKQIATEHLRDVFKDIDLDGDGLLSVDEMMYFLADPSVYTYMEALDINLNDARTLFQLIDADTSGSIDIDEFCDGCMRLKGDAKAFDVHCLIREMSRFFEKWSSFTEYIAQRLGPVQQPEPTAHASPHHDVSLGCMPVRLEQGAGKDHATSLASCAGSESFPVVLEEAADTHHAISLESCGGSTPISL